MSTGEITRWISVLRCHYSATSESKPTVEEVVNATRYLTAAVCGEELRDHQDFTKILSFVLSSFIKLSNDETLQIWSVADECLLTTIKPLVKLYPARVLSELLKGIKSGKGRSQRSSIEKFASLCTYINPQKCRNFVSLLLNSLEEIILTGDSAVQQTLGDNFDNICATLIYYMRESEAQQLIQALVNNLDSSEASTRRAAAKCITSLCRHYPKSLFGFSFAIIVLKRFQVLKHSSEIEGEEPVDEKTASCRLQGILYVLVQLLKLSHELSKNKHDPRDPMLCNLTDIIPLIEYSLQHLDHNVVSGCIELVDAILSMYEGWKCSRKENEIISFLIGHFIEFLLPKDLRNDSCGDAEPQQRVSIIAMSLQVLGRISYCYTSEFLLFFSEHQNASIELYEKIICNLLAGIESEDPLLHGKTLFFASCLLRIKLQEQSQEDHRNLQNRFQGKSESTTSARTILDSKRIQVDKIFHDILVGVQESSSVTSQESCVALEMLLPIVGRTKHSGILIDVASRLTNFKHAYWLIRSRILNFLSTFDFALLAMLEKDKLRSKLSNKQYTRYARDTLQQHILYFMLQHLEDEDSRVVDAAACALRDIIPNLYRETYHIHSNSHIMLQETVNELKNSAAKTEKINEKIKENLSIILPLLLNGINLPQYENSLSGYYHAWRIIFEWICKCDCGTGAWLYDISKLYASELIPLTLTRLTGTSLSLSIDEHIEIIQLFGYFFLPFSRKLHPSLPSPRMYLPSVLRHLWKAVTTHIMRLLHVLMALHHGSTELVVRETKPSVQMLGSFSNLPLYIDLYNMLLRQKLENVITSLSPTRTEELVDSCLISLSGLIRCAGKDCMPFFNEFIHVLCYFVDLFPRSVASVAIELIQGVSVENTPSHSTNTSTINRTMSESSIPSPSSPQQRTRKRLQRSVANIRNHRKCSISNLETNGEANGTIISSILDFRNDLSITTPRRVSVSLPRTTKTTSTQPNISQTSTRKRDLLKRSLNVSTKPNPTMQAKLEPLIKKLLEIYIQTHDLKLQQTILRLVSCVEANNLNLRQFDNESKTFINFVVNQVLGKRSYLKDPPRILPYIYDFVSQLTITRTDQVSMDSIKRLTTCVFTSPQWGDSGRLLPSIHSLLFNFYAASISSVDHAACIDELRAHFYDNLIARLPLVPAASALYLIMSFIKNRAQEMYLQYSHGIFNALLPLLIDSPPICTINDLEVLQELLLVLDSSVIQVEQIIDGVLVLWSKKSSSDFSWVCGILILLHVLCVHANSKFEVLKTKFETENCTGILFFCFRVLDELTAIIAMDSCGLHVNIVQRFMQHVIYLAELLNEPKETGNLLDLNPHSPAADERLLPFLMNIQTRLLSMDNITMVFLLFKLARVINCSNPSFWKVTQLQSLSEYFDGSLRPLWFVSLVGEVSVLSFAKILYQSGVMLDLLIEETLGNNYFIQMMIMHCLEPNVRMLLGILPQKHFLRIIDSLRSLCESNLIPQNILPIEFIWVLFSALGNRQTNENSIISVISLVAHFVGHKKLLIPYSTRKLIRRLVKNIINIFTKSEDSVLFETLSNEQLHIMFHSISILKSSKIYRAGSDQAESLRGFIKTLENKMNANPSVTVFDDLSPPNNGEELSNSSENLSFDKFARNGFTKGKYHSLASLALLDISLLHELLNSESTNVFDVAEFVLDNKNGFSTFAIPQPSESITNAPTDLLTFENETTKATKETQETLHNKIMIFFQKKICASFQSFVEYSEVSASLVSIINDNPSLVQCVTNQTGITEVISFCDRAICLYFTEERYRHRIQPLHCIASVLQLTSFALTTSNDNSWQQEEETIRLLVSGLYKLFLICLNQSEPIFDVIAPQYKTTIDWEISRVSDILTEMVIKLLTPKMQEECSFVTPLDTRPSTLFQFCHGQFAFNSFIDLLTCLTRAVAGNIYPELIEESNDLFLETPIVSLGMTASDIELLQNAIQLLPIVFISNHDHLEQIFKLFEQIILSKNSCEPLKVIACKGISVLVHLLQYIHIYQTFSPNEENRFQEESKADFFISSIPGKKLLQIQSFIQGILIQHPEKIQQHVKHFGNINASRIRFQDGNFARAEVEIDLEQSFSVALQQGKFSPISLQFLYQKRYLWVTRDTISKIVPRASKLLFKTAKQLQGNGNLIFLREYCLASLIGIIGLLDDNDIQELIQLCSFIYDQDAPGDIYGMQLAVVGFCSGICESKKRGLKIPSISLSSIPGKIRYCFESIHSSGHIAALRSLHFLVQGKFHEIVVSLLPNIFAFANNIWNENNEDCKVVEVQYNLIILVFRILENYTKEVEQFNFVKGALENLIRMVESPNVPGMIIACIFRGLNGLLISFSLSHSQRMLVRSCALQHLPSSLFPFALGLMLSCMYTGDESERKSTNAMMDSTNVQMNNIERVKILFVKIHSGFVVEAEVVSRIIPRLLIDFFSQEQVMSLLLGEFVRTSQQQRPELIAQVLFDVVDEYREDAEKWQIVLHWTCLCLKNFIQMEPYRYSLWAMSCLFVSVSESKPLRCLYREIAKNSKILDENVFMCSAHEFYNNPRLPNESKEAFLTVFDSAHPLSLRLLEICKN